MTAAFRQLLVLAGGLCAEQGAALRQGLGPAHNESTRGAGSSGFIPGGMVHGPHLAPSRPAISALPGGHGRHSFGGPRVAVPAPRRYAPLLMMGPQGGPPADSGGGGMPDSPGDLLKQIGLARSLVSDIRAQVVLKEWERDVLGTYRDWPTAKKAIDLLDLMYDGLDSSAPRLVFALADRKEAGDVEVEDIQAIATMTQQFAGNQFFNEAHDFQQVALVVRPTAARQRQLGKHLIRYMVEWSRLRGEMLAVAPTTEFSDYYRSLGFAPNDSFWLYDAVNEGSAVEEELDRRKFKLVLLDIDVPRRMRT